MIGHRDEIQILWNSAQKMEYFTYFDYNLSFLGTFFNHVNETHFFLIIKKNFLF